MSHELEIDDNGRARMFYVGETPWHELGVKLDSPPSVREAIRLAGLDWTVEMHPLFCEINGEKVKVNRKASVRSTDGRVLGVVGPSYVPLQNSEAFEFFEPFVESGAVALETAGSLRGGRRIWVLGRTKVDPVEIVPGDEVLQYVLLSNGHDGTLANRVGLTNVRVVCANTEAAARDSKASKLLRIRHTSGAHEALAKVGEVLDVARQEFLATTEQYKALARKGVRKEDLLTYVRKVFRPTVVTDEVEEKARCERLAERITPLFEKGRGNDMPGVSGTWWAMYNSLSNFLTHERGRDIDIRMDSLWHGEGYTLNQRALGTALQMAYG